MLVESNGVLECSSELHVNCALYEVVNSLTLLEKLVSVVVDVLLRNVPTETVTEDMMLYSI